MPISSVDDQLSTEPIPSDFDHRDIFRSSPPCIQQKAPVTTPNIPNQTNSRNSASSSHQVEKPKSKIDDTGNNERQLRPRLARQSPPISRARGRQAKRNINSLDGSVEGHSSADGEDSASSALEAECHRTNIDDDDDEYQLSESENDEGDSEQSIIDEMKNPRKTTNKKPSKTTNSSKPGGKQAAKAKIASVTSQKVGRPITNKTTVLAQKRPVAPNQVVHSPKRLSVSLDELLPVRQNVEPATGRSEQKGKDVIPDSQDFVADSQVNAIPLKAKSKAINSRRPKKPFYQHGPGAQQTNPDSTTSVCSITDTHQQSTARQGKVLYSSPDETELRGNSEAEASDQRKHTALNTRQSEAKVDKGKGRAVDQTQPLPTTYEVDSPPINQSSDQPSQLDDAEYVEMRLHSSSPYHTEAETSKKLGSSEPGELLANGTKMTPVMRESFRHADVSTQAYLPQLSSGPVRLDCVVEAKNEATQTKTLGAQPLLQNIYYRGEFEEGAVGNDTTRRWFLSSPRVQDASEPSRINAIAAGVQKECEQGGKQEKDPSVKTFRDLSNMATPLHPTSRAWARGIAKKSRRNEFKISAPQTNTGETKPLGQTPRKITESHQNPISKRETALGGQRNAIFDSIQEITMAVLQHLESKESAIDSIVGIYQQSGRQVLDKLLDRQSIELRQAASDFDSKCIRLENLFDESARHAQAISGGMSDENSRYLKGWARRSKELEETIKLVRDAAASI
ncbi:hypothetical protein F5B21DRAFT_528538 [Xylaria acuta]|nr:hypothetical protein F5B21DRAFT_528538 [Xylaria acuta]